MQPKIKAEKEIEEELINEADIDMKKNKPKPKVAIMVDQALNVLHKRSGCSLQAVKKYISATFDCNESSMKRMGPRINKQIIEYLENNTLVKVTGKINSVQGKFKLTKNAKTVEANTKEKSKNNKPKKSYAKIEEKSKNNNEEEKDKTRKVLKKTNEEIKDHQKSEIRLGKVKNKTEKKIQMNEIKIKKKKERENVKPVSNKPITKVVVRKSLRGTPTGLKLKSSKSKKKTEKT